MKSLVIFISVFFLLVTCAFCQNCTPELKIFKAEHGNAESLYEVASSLMSQEGKASLDRNTQSIIISDCPWNLERIAQVLGAIDVQEKQVEIKVLVAETTERLLSDIGITAGQVIIPQAEFGAVIRLLEGDKDTSIRSEMTVKTLSNQPATLQVTTDEIIGTNLVIIKDEAAVVSALRKPVGNLLEVLPRVNNDGTINITVRPSVSEMQENGVPSESAFFTQVVVNNGDTISIGGVQAQRESVEKRRAFFGIPLSQRTETKKKAVVMFLTAKVIE
jgi:type II secretory pathway component GspD/PulD (secretin)